MAKANVKTKMIKKEVKVVTEVPVREVTLTLTMEEAVTLRDIFTLIGGAPGSGCELKEINGTTFGEFSPRHHTSVMNAALFDAGVPYISLEHQPANGRATGIYYSTVDREEFQQTVETAVKHLGV